MSDLPTSRTGRAFFRLGQITARAIFLASLVAVGVFAHQASAQSIARLPVDGRVNSLAFSADGKTLVAASGVFHALLQGPLPGKVWIWDVATRKLKTTLGGHADGITSAQYSPDGRLLITAGYDGSIRVRDAGTFADVQVIKPGIGVVNSFAFSPDGKRLVAAVWGGNADDAENSFVVVEVATGKVLKVIPAHEDAVSVAVFSPDGKSIVTASHDGSIKLWNADSLKELRRMSVVEDGMLSCLAISPDGLTLVVGGGNLVALPEEKTPGRLKLLDPTDWSERTTLTLPGYVFAAAFSADGESLAIGGNDGLLRLLDPTGREMARLGADRADAYVRSVCFSPDGRLLAAGCSDSVEIWNVP